MCKIKHAYGKIMLKREILITTILPSGEGLDF
jgi:hypothetical protein